MQQNNFQTPNANKIRIVTNILTAALKLWLRSQVSQVSQLEVEIEASDRQLLSGCIPLVSIFASHAVYRGLHLTQVQLVAKSIRVNIGSVLRGQPLKLLETVPVAGELSLEEEDLNASLTSDLLLTALNEAMVKLLPEHSPKSKSINWQKIHLNHNNLVLYATLPIENELTYLDISMGLHLLSSHELQLEQIQVKSSPTDALFEVEPTLYFNLGSDVDIEELTVTNTKLVCRGRINVNP